LLLNESLPASWVRRHPEQRKPTHSSSVNPVFCPCYSPNEQRMGVVRKTTLSIFKHEVTDATNKKTCSAIQ
jgi:hypothetical protein